MLSFLQVDKGRLFFIKLSFVEFKIHEIFITAYRSAWPVLKQHQVAKFLKNFQVNFVLCSQESDVRIWEYRYFILDHVDLLYISRSP